MSVRVPERFHGSRSGFFLSAPTTTGIMLEIRSRYFASPYIFSSCSVVGPICDYIVGSKVQCLGQIQ